MSGTPRFLLCLLAALLAAGSLAAQSTGTVQGTITRSDDGDPIPGVTVTVAGTAIQTVTDQRGNYFLPRVPAGAQTLSIRWIGFRARQESVAVQAGGRVRLDVALEPVPIALSDIIVTGATRGPERVVESPSAVSVVDSRNQAALSPAGQVPVALAGSPGIDVVQNGVNDFNINARGFNTVLNRRVLVLQDGRDLAIPFLGNQEWYAVTAPLDEMGKIEIVRGPGSALYGANAFSGVVNITTPYAREVAGTKLSVAGGELETRRADARFARVFGDQRYGVRINAGYYRSDSWNRSRTNLGDLKREYAGSVDTSTINAPTPGFELLPLRGQTKQGPFGTPGPSTGDRDPMENVYGSARFDYYGNAGKVLTIEGGAAGSRNETTVTAIGRTQVNNVFRPWARVAYGGDRFYAMAWYSGRNTWEPIHALSTGQSFEDVSNTFAAEVQGNWRLWDSRARVVAGVSGKTSAVNSQATLMPSGDDDRSDQYSSAYAQMEFSLTPRLKLIGAARVDGSDLYATQFSPRGALVFSPNERHSFRVNINHAFQTPSILEYFLRLPIGAPADLSPLEAGLRASPIGPMLANVPNGTLFTTSSAVPLLALGNRDLELEKTTMFELGYKGQVESRLYVSVEGYYSKLTNFVTSLLPGVNPSLGPWTAPTQVAPADRPVVEQAVQQALIGAGQAFAAAALTRIPGDTTAIVVSVGNAGRATEHGIELGAGYQLGHGFLLEANYTYFDFSVKRSSVATGDSILPNTPKHKGSVSVSYQGREGLDVRLAMRFNSAFDWASGVLLGPVPSAQTVDLSAGYQLTPWLRLTGVATNLLDQARYQVFGGSVIRRRIIAGVTTTF